MFLICPLMVFRHANSWKGNCGVTLAASVSGIRVTLLDASESCGI